MSSKIDQFFMDLAKAAARAGTCIRLQVGSVLVRDSRVLGIGYNGAPKGSKHCLEAGCDIVKYDGRDHCKRAVHADQNAILNAAYHGVSTAGATLYTTHSPCYDCAKMLINSGIVKVIYNLDYDDVKTINLFAEVSIERSRFSRKD